MKAFNVVESAIYRLCNVSVSSFGNCLVCMCFVHTYVCAIVHYIVPPVYLVSCSSSPMRNGVCACAVIAHCFKTKNKNEQPALQLGRTLNFVCKET